MSLWTPGDVIQRADDDSVYDSAELTFMTNTTMILTSRNVYINGEQYMYMYVHNSIIHTINVDVHVGVSIMSMCAYFIEMNPYSKKTRRAYLYTTNTQGLTDRRSCGNLKRAAPPPPPKAAATYRVFCLSFSLCRFLLASVSSVSLASELLVLVTRG